MLLRPMNQEVTVHGFRSAFIDLAEECTGYSLEDAEMALAHTIGNAVEPAGLRGDFYEKRRLLSGRLGNRMRERCTGWW